MFAQETSAIPLKANIRRGGGRGVRRGVVLFSVFMTRHAWGYRQWWVGHVVVLFVGGIASPWRLGLSPDL